MSLLINYNTTPTNSCELRSAFVPTNTTNLPVSPTKSVISDCVGEYMMHLLVVNFLVVLVFVVVRWVTRNFGPPATALQGKGTWIKVRISEKEELSADTFKFTFRLPGDQDQRLGLPVGQHCYIKLEGNYKPYTPVSSDQDVGRVAFVIKIYPEGSDLKGPGLTAKLDKLQVGDYVEISGPIGHVNYKAPGVFEQGYGTRTSLQTDHIVCLAMGTGITPMLQVINKIRSDPLDNTRVDLLYGNKTEQDILCRAVLNALRDVNYSVTHFLSRMAPEDVTVANAKTGRISMNDLPTSVNETTMFLLCGSKRFQKDFRKKIISKYGCDQKRVVVF